MSSIQNLENLKCQEQEIREQVQLHERPRTVSLAEFPSHLKYAPV